MQSFHLEVDQLRQIFKYNDYPVTLIDQCVKDSSCDYNVNIMITH